MSKPSLAGRILDAEYRMMNMRDIYERSKRTHHGLYLLRVKEQYVDAKQTYDCLMREWKEQEANDEHSK